MELNQDFKLVLTASNERELEYFHSNKQKNVYIIFQTNIYIRAIFFQKKNLTIKYCCCFN